MFDENQINNKFIDTTIPLTVRIIGDRFNSIIRNENFSDIYSNKGIVIDGIKVSTSFKINKDSMFNTIKAIKNQKNYKFYNLIYSPDYRSNSLILNNKFNLDVYVFSCGDYDRVIPGIIVSDESGDPYFVYSELAMDITTPIIREGKGNLNIIPFTHQTWSVLKEKTTINPLTKVLSNTKNYKVYIVEGGDNPSTYKYGEYFRKVLTKFDFNETTLNLVNNFFNVPLIDLSVDENNEYTITKRIVYEPYVNRIRLGGLDDHLVVLSSGRYNVINNGLLGKINNASGESYLLTQTKKFDKENNKILIENKFINGISNGFVAGGVATYSESYNEEEIRKSRVKFNYLVEKSKEAKLNKTRDDLQREAIEAYFEAVFNNIGYDALTDFELGLKQSLNLNIDKREVVEFVGNKIEKIAESYVRNKCYDKCIMMSKVQKIFEDIHNKYAGK